MAPIHQDRHQEWCAVAPHVGLDEELCRVFVELIDEEEAMLRAERADPRMHWDSYIFSDSPVGFEPWYPDTLSHKLAAARRVAGVTGGRRSQSRVPITFRSLRVYCASQVYSNELDVRTAKAVLGHASMATTDRYYLAFEDEKRREATVTIGDVIVAGHGWRTQTDWPSRWPLHLRPRSHWGCVVRTRECTHTVRRHGQ